MIVYFTADLALVTDRYVFQGGMPVLLVLSRMLPVVYFTLLFLLLFEWVLERLLTTYRSSITDGLTGLYNRRHFQQRRSCCSAAAKESPSSFATSTTSRS